MALAIGNKTVDLATPSASTRTFSHNGSVGANRYLFVVIAMADTVSINSVTYGGVTMILQQVTVASTTNVRRAIYYLANPLTGANNVVITFSAGQFNPVSTFAFSATGCNGIGNVAIDDTAVSPNSATIAVSANSMIFGALVAGSTVSHVITLDGSSRPLEYTSSINNGTSGALSLTGLTSGTKNVSVAAATTVAGLYFEIKEFAAVSSTMGMMMLM